MKPHSSYCKLKKIHLNKLYNGNGACGSNSLCDAHFTWDVEKVTCEACKKTLQFKGA